MSNQLQLKIKYLKLKRINELNNNLRNELSRDRITASNASLTIINYCKNEIDYTLPELWGYPELNSNHFRVNNNLTNGFRRAQANANSDANGCCIIT